MENNKLETALHIACRGKGDDNILKELLKADCDVNARNLWGQTPLHYAAESNSITKIQLLLQVPSIDVKLTDINGYNALHILINCGKAFDKDFEDGIDALINAGICINAKTNSDQTVLHLAAMQYTNTDKENEILKYILCKYQDTEKLIKNKMGENFLHLFMKNQHQSGIILKLLREISKLDNSLPPKLLNEKNFRGQTPFYVLVIRNRVSSDIIGLIIQKYRACVKTTDNLGNTMLHHLVKSIPDDDAADNIKMLVKNGAKINVQNIWGITAAFKIDGLQNDDIYNQMIGVYRTIDLRVTDRWGRTPIFGIVNTNKFPFARILKRMLTEFDLDINYQDKYGTTLLHLIGYIKDKNVDLQDIKQFLVDITWLTPLDIKDKENNKPYQTALCHGNFETFKMIAAKMSNEILVDDFEIFTYLSLKKVKLSTLLTPGHVNGFPRDREKFANDLLRMKHVDFHPEANSEETDIYKSVGTLIEKVCDKVKAYDSKFQMHIFRTGSTSEGTKVGRPDEFDFALCLDVVEQNCNIETLANEDNIVFAMLKFKDEPFANDFLPFYDEDRYLQVLPVLVYLFRYIQRALYEPDIWADGNIVFNNELKVLREKPVFNFSISWVGSKYKHLNISVDLVPVVHKRGWWPPGFDLSMKNVVNEQVRNAGCFVLLQNKTETYDFIDRWVTGMQDCVFDTCNLSVDVEETETKTKRRCLTLSVAPAEIALIKSFPEQFRKAYALAKIVKDKMVCPKVIIDIYPGGCDLLPDTKEYVSVTHPDKEVKSYWLKNCTFYVAEYLRDAYEDLEHTNISTVEMTVMIYEKLLELVSESRISPYLYQSTDVLMLEKKEEWRTEHLKEMLLFRKLSIDVVLKFLGRNIRGDNTEWLEYCMKHYVHRVYSEEENKNCEIQLYRRQ